MCMTWCLMCVLGLSIYRIEASVNADDCRVKPKEKHCLIEWMVREKWPHVERWVYDNHQRKCHTIRWANHCPDPEPGTNNFVSESECASQCSGWE